MAGLKIKDEPADTGYDLAESGGVKLGKAVPPSLANVLLSVSPTTATATQSSVPLSLVSLPNSTTGVSKGSPSFTFHKPGTSLLGGRMILKSVPTSGKSQPFFIISPSQPVNASKLVPGKAPFVGLQHQRLVRPSMASSTMLPNKIVYSSSQQRAVILSNPQQTAVVQPVTKSLVMKNTLPIQPKPLVIEPTFDDELPQPLRERIKPHVNTVVEPADHIDSVVLTNDITEPPPHITDTNSEQSGKTQTVCSVVFSKGGSPANKLYLCNFCTFSAASYQKLNRHLADHVFSCNHCSFKAFTRFQVLKHRRTKHPDFSYELEGYENLNVLQPVSQASKEKVQATHSATRSYSASVSVCAATSTNSLAASATDVAMQVASKTTTTPTLLICPKQPEEEAVGNKPVSPLSPKANVPTSSTDSPPEDRSQASLKSPQRSPVDSPVTQSVKLWKCYYCEQRSEVQSDLVQHIKACHQGKPFKLQSISRVTKGHRTPPRDSDAEDMQASKQFMWCCYYCDITNNDRNGIIAHVKADHKGSKIVIRRKKIGSPEGKSSGDEGPPTLNRFDIDSDTQEGRSLSPKHPSLEPQLKKIDESPSAPPPQSKPLKQAPSLADKEVAAEESSSAVKNKNPSLKSIEVRYALSKANKPEESLMTLDRENKSAKCLTCSKVFTGKSHVSHMREHILIHSSLWPWQCSLCSSTFKRRSPACLHFLEKHGGPCAKIVRYTTNQDLIGKIERTLVGKGKTKQLSSSMADEQSVKSKRPVRIKQSVLGPRSIREKYIREHALYMWKCPYCSRHSVHKGLILVHIKFVHPAKRISVDPWKIKRPSSQLDSQEWDRYEKKRRASVSLIRLEDMNKYGHLNDVMESAGGCLINDMDQDDNAVLGELPPRKMLPTKNPARKKRESVSKPSSAKIYSCKYCTKGFSSTVGVKRHLYNVHLGEEVVVNLTSPKGNLSTLFLCAGLDCRFSSVVRGMMDVHYVRNPKHRPDISTTPSWRLTSVSSTSERTLNPTTDVDRTSFAITVNRPSKTGGVEFPGVYEPGLTQPQHELPPPGATVFSSPKLGLIRCVYCDAPATLDHHDLKNHLLLEHPTENPRVAAVSADDGESQLLCPVLLCEYYCSEGKELATHITRCHPDIEINIPLLAKYAADLLRGTKKKRKKEDSDDERDLDFNPKRPYFDPDFQKVVGKKTKPKKLKNKDIKLSEGANIEMNRLCSEINSPAYRSRDLIQESFSCNVCKERLRLLDEMKVHLATFHQTKPFSSCTDLKARKQHKRSQIIFCPREGCDFISLLGTSDVLAHLSEHHGEQHTEGDDLDHAQSIFHSSDTKDCRPASEKSPEVDTVTTSRDLVVSKTDVEANTDKHGHRTEVRHSDQQAVGECEPSTLSYTDTGKRENPSLDPDTGSVQSGDDTGEGITQKDYEEIGEELKRLNKDLENLLNADRATSSQNPKKGHDHTTSSEPELRISQQHRVSPDKKNKDISKPPKSAGQKQDHKSNFDGNDNTKQPNAASACSSVSSDEDSASDDQEMPDITADRFSPKRSGFSESFSFGENRDNVTRNRGDLEDRASCLGTNTVDKGDEDAVDEKETALKTQASENDATLLHEVTARVSADKLPPVQPAQDSDEQSTPQCPHEPSYQNTKDDSNSEPTEAHREEQSPHRKAPVDSELNCLETNKVISQQLTNDQSSSSTKQGPVHSGQDPSPDETNQGSQKVHTVNPTEESHGGAKMYQCHECLFMTTSHSNITDHLKEHGNKDAGFMEIDTSFDQEGNIITSVNG